MTKIIGCIADNGLTIYTINGDVFALNNTFGLNLEWHRASLNEAGAVDLDAPYHGVRWEHQRSMNDFERRLAAHHGHNII